MGILGASLMLRRVGGDVSDFPENTYMKPYLVERGSVAKL